MTGPLLRVESLTVTIGAASVVEDISFEIRPGEMLGLVGESGCGKTVAALSLLRLLPDPPARIAAGRILFRDEDLLGISAEELRAVRGDRIGMIFQEPMSSLNPVFTAGDQIEEAVLLHRPAGRPAARSRASELLSLVGLPAAVRERYPHQLSGGQRQRVMIAMALANEPDLLVADEPTTALDVTVQAQILDLIDRLRAEFGMAVLLITHDLGVVAEVCDRVAVMYAGRIVETAPTPDFFKYPRHRYTRALMRTVPAANRPGTRLPTVAGVVPAPGQRLAGCSFAPRCDAPVPRCPSEVPALSGESHRIRCWNPADEHAP